MSLIVKKLVITMEKKALAQLALAFFIGLIFISSYISLTNYNSQQSATTTIPSTYFAQGFAEAKVVGYGSSLYFNLTCKSPAIRSLANNAISENLTVLENNNSVFNFYSSGRDISVEPGNMSAYQVYSFVSSKLNSTIYNCTSVLATILVKLPGIINLTVGTQKVGVQVPKVDSNASILLPINYTVGKPVRVKLSTLITANETVYGPINIVVVK